MGKKGCCVDGTAGGQIGKNCDFYALTNPRQTQCLCGFEPLGLDTIEPLRYAEVKSGRSRQVNQTRKDGKEYER